MTIDISYREDGGVVATVKTVLNGRDCMAFNDTIYADAERIAKITYQIIDLSQVEQIEINADEIRRIAAQDAVAAEINPDMRIAVVGESEVTYGLSRMWQAYTDDLPISRMVFRTMSEAETWLQEQG